ncbi:MULTISPECIES: NfeD family protein [unclassified Micromonospora]|uniref:NfeD family protein n=1 Tax=Micromonospora TaxID=1873 RepID=UPI00188E6A5A|nr:MULTISPECIES: NfeD family protein [unclassified Micromonospora]MBF5033468.1 NfeD family protein [Micromonospora sp. ANENR4]MCZ7476368.1 NfeD family protein [Micromonospora sp. WMMC273]MDW3848932.1 NfeD family protein [Micromonospora sp. BRA006-A]MEE3917766.1 NfeD family protein [Micromonospora sp. BRA006-A]WBC01206.1 NfeD family protein [Micromonospora sp. WMMA1976]
MDAVFWIVLGVVLAVAEIFTTTLFLIMFGVGAFAAAGAAALGAPVALQAVVFAVVSALSVAVVRPVVRRHARPALETGEQPFGVEALEGATAVVLEPVDADRGMVKIDGELWTARSYDATRTYAEGERVQVIKVRGATALVWQDDISTPGELPEAKR